MSSADLRAVAERRLHVSVNSCQYVGLFGELWTVFLFRFGLLKQVEVVLAGPPCHQIKRHRDARGAGFVFSTDGGALLVAVRKISPETSLCWSSSEDLPPAPLQDLSCLVLTACVLFEP